MGFLGGIGDAVSGIFSGIGGSLSGEGTAVGPAYRPNEAAFGQDPEQSRYLAYLGGQAYGGAAPSAAEQMIQQQTQKSNEQMAGAMGSTRGVQNPALLAKQAAMINAGNTQQAVGQGAILRAQEQQAAQQSYADQMGAKQQNQMNLEAMKANIASGQQQLEFNAAEGGKNRQSQMIGGMMGAAATLGAASDIRVKENIEPAQGQAKDYLDFQYRKMLNNIDPYTYDYKNKKYGEGKQLGVMAQDLEKSPLGKGMVDTKDGKKQINANISTILAGQAVLNDRLNKIEGNQMGRSFLDAYNDPDSYESPGYVEDPNRPKFTLDLMNIGGVGQRPSEDQVGQIFSPGASYEGYRPRKIESTPVLANNIPDYPMENPPSKVPSALAAALGGSVMGAGAKPKPMNTQAIDAQIERDRIAKANYLMDVYNKTKEAFSPQSMGPTNQYQPQRIPNFEQYRPTRRR